MHVYLLFNSIRSEMWRNASAKERAPYVEEEQGQRAVYKEKIKKFREEQAKVDAASRTSHKSVQKHLTESYVPPLTATRPYEPLNPSSLAPAFESSVRIGTVEDAVNKADQRMMFRHHFGAPSASTFRQSHYGELCCW